MFITELTNIYKKNPLLAEFVPYEEIAPQLLQFLNQEVRLGAKYLNPYRFSYAFGHEPKNIISLFIAFSNDDGFLKRLYKYDCTTCETTNLINDEQLKNFECYECHSSDSINSSNFLEDVKVIFEIREDLLKEVQNRLKKQASSEDRSKISSVSEGAQQTKSEKDVTLKDILINNVNPDTNPIDNKLLAIEQLIQNKMLSGVRAI